MTAVPSPVTAVIRCQRCGNPIRATRPPAQATGLAGGCSSCPDSAPPPHDPAPEPGVPSVKYVISPRERHAVSDAERLFRVALTAVGLMLLFGALGSRRERTTEGRASLRRKGPAVMGLASPVEGPTAAPVLSPASLVEVRTGPSGVLTQVTGPDPRSVLEAFCAHPSLSNRYLVEAISPGIFAGSGQLQGLLLEREHNFAVKGVLIDRDPRTHRWTIGNGLGPIVVLDAAHLRSRVDR